MAATRVICDPVVIHMLLEPWLDGKGRAVRYYLNGWRRHIPAEGARAYFDLDGRLHVDGCLDTTMRAAIEDWAEGWYGRKRGRLGRPAPGSGGHIRSWTS